MNAYRPPVRQLAETEADELAGLHGSHPYSRTCNCDACFETWLAMPEPTPAEREAMARAFSAALCPSGGGVLLTDFPVTFPGLDEAERDQAMGLLNDDQMMVLGKGQRTYRRNRV